MTTPHHLDELSTEAQHQIGRAVEQLQREFAATFNHETIESFVVDSYERLAATAKTTVFLPILTEKFARERLNAISSLEGTAPRAPGVLFLCVHNAGRSQMAAGWLRQIAGDRVRVYTGGSEPSAELNPVVIQAMDEAGVDLRDEFPKPWTDDVVRAVDVVVSMGCGDACPVYPGKRYVDWELDDPAGRDLPAVRLIRDEIKRRVNELVNEL
jgi:arsenate reductase (thioredoxin)